MARMGGYRLVGEVLLEGQCETLPRLDEERVRSAVPGLELRVRERGPGGGSRKLLFFDPVTGKDLWTRREERQSGVRTEREIARLRTMLAQMPGAGAKDAPSDGA